MAASFTLTNITTNSVGVRIVPDSAYARYRIFVVNDDSGATIHDTTYNISSTSTKTFSGLSPGTNYRVNVGYTNNTGTQPRVDGYIGVQYFTTKEIVYYSIQLNYNANGGYGAPSSQVSTNTSNSVSITITDDEPYRDGYIFQGWSTSSSASSPSYYAGKSYTFTGSTSTRTYTLYAVWKPVYSVIIYYNANGGSGAPGEAAWSNTSSSLPVTISTTRPTRNGYIFLGWSTSSTATTASYEPGETYNFTGSTSTRTYTLYAVWEKIEYITVINYDANGGTGGPSTQTAKGEGDPLAVTISSTIPTREGYTFLGWALFDFSTEPVYLAGGTYEFQATPGNGTTYLLYAVWEEKIRYYVKITYNANGGTGEPETEQFSDTDDAITVTISSVMPTREGYTFLGWSFDRTATSADWLAGGVYYNWKGSTDVTTVTLYAVWLRTTRYGGVWINGQYYIPWIYSNGWQKYASYVYSNGWKTTKD